MTSLPPFAVPFNKRIMEEFYIALYNAFLVFNKSMPPNGAIILQSFSVSDKY